MTNPEEGWYPDPDGGQLLRYWDGTEWTDSYHDPIAADGGQPPTGWTAGDGASVYDDDSYGQDYGDYADDDRFMGPPGPPPWIIPAAIAAVAALVIIGFLFLRGGDDTTDATDDPTATVDATSTTTPTSDAPTGEPTTEATETTAPGETPTTAPEAPSDERQATLLVDFARLRADASLSAAAVTTIQNKSGTEVTVVGPGKDGWYNIKVGGFEGWMFGAFLDPADGDLQVVVSNADKSLTLRNASGDPLGIANASGMYGLVTDSSDATLWQLILADGSTAYVNAADVTTVS